MRQLRVVPPRLERLLHARDEAVEVHAGHGVQVCVAPAVTSPRITGAGLARPADV